MTFPATHMFDLTVRPDSIPAEGRALHVTAGAGQLETLAEIMQVSGVDLFKADLTAKKFRGGVEITGRLRAGITQPCVVTLDPVHQEIDEPVERVFLPGRDVVDEAPPGAEIYVDLEDDNPPDSFSGPDLDLEPLLIEALALAIDPYPRSPGAQLPAAAIDDAGEDEHPFAALGRLRTGGKDEKD